MKPPSPSIEVPPRARPAGDKTPARSSGHDVAHVMHDVLYSIAVSAEEHWTEIGALLKKYSDRPISLADACLIRCAEIYQEARIFTFDRDFGVYKWARKKNFELV
jgi:predicted nucleic acid-binding protein